MLFYSIVRISRSYIINRRYLLRTILVKTHTT